MLSDPDDLLSFKEFPETHGNSGSTSSAAQININSPVRTINPSKLNSATSDSLNDITNFSNNQQNSSQENNEGKQQFSFWSMEYYQQFFNVDTIMVVERIVNSIIPRRAPGNYLKSYIGSNPDLYGPLWITVTLIFSIAISGNVASYLQHASVDYKWRYDFHLVSLVSTTIFIYAVIVPFILWGLFKWSLKPIETDLEMEMSGYTPSLLSLMCIYGYSLAIYIPVSILWVIQISYLQWLLVITAAFLSGSVLILVLAPALRNSNISLFLMIGISSAHFLLAAGFMLYFFHVPDDNGLPDHSQQAPISNSVIKLVSSKAPNIVASITNANKTS